MRKDKAMQYTEKELLTNIKKSLVALLTDAEKRHEQTRIELPMSIEQARWLGRKVQELLKESEEGSKEESLFADNPWNYEYDLSEEDKRLPSPHDWFDDDFVRRWKRRGDDEGRTKLIPKEVRDSRLEKIHIFEEDECKEIEQHVARKVRPYN